MAAAGHFLTGRAQSFIKHSEVHCRGGTRERREPSQQHKHWLTAQSTALPAASRNHTTKQKKCNLSLRLSTKDGLLSPANNYGLTAKVLQHFDILQSVKCSVAVAVPPCLTPTAATQPFSRQRGKHLHLLRAWYCQSP